MALPGYIVTSSSPVAAAAYAEYKKLELEPKGK